MDSRARRRVVVLGGGMAGLFATRVLARFYQEVIVVDRDELAGVAGPRRGVPQGGHAHALLARGQLALEELFSGLTEDIAGLGCPMLDIGQMHWHAGGRRLRPHRTGLVVAALSRPMLESEVRARVTAMPGVRLLERHELVELLRTPGGERVTGARVRPPDGEGGSVELAADLVVDTTGRGSRTPRWLEDLGYPRPAEDQVKIDLAYTTCEFRLSISPLERDRSIIVLATPSSRTGAFFGRVVGDHYILSVTSMLTDHPQPDLEGFRNAVKSLPVPRIHEAIADVEPVRGPSAFRFPASVRRRYERLARFPAGLLVMGDGVCSFNPVYGQGMTVAALEALELRRHLTRGDPLEAPGFFQDIARVVDSPWDIAAGGDLAWPEAEGRRTAKIRIGNAYLAQLQAAATRDGRLTEAFMRVAGLIDPPQSLMHPRVARRVLWQSLRRKRPELDAEPAIAASGHL